MNFEASVASLVDTVHSLQQYTVHILQQYCFCCLNCKQSVAALGQIFSCRKMHLFEEITFIIKRETEILYLKYNGSERTSVFSKNNLNLQRGLFSENALP